MPQEQWKTRWKDYYEILQVHHKAQSEVITAAYRRLSKLHHPDSSASSDDSRMKDMNEAKAVLLDEASRTSYDQAYREGQANPSPPAGGEPQRGSSPKDKTRLATQRSKAGRQAREKNYQKLLDFENKVGVWMAAGKLPDGSPFEKEAGHTAIRLARGEYDEYLLSLIYE
jgi:DnaJ-class molecular chaperone